eukprot:COSAG01_NODE_6330_length_3732_cov_11.357831_1_plen_195_part_00
MAGLSHYGIYARSLPELSWCSASQGGAVRRTVAALTFATALGLALRLAMINTILPNKHEFWRVTATRDALQSRLEETRRNGVCVGGLAACPAEVCECPDSISQRCPAHCARTLWQPGQYHVELIESATSTRILVFGDSLALQLVQALNCFVNDKANVTADFSPMWVFPIEESYLSMMERVNPYGVFKEVTRPKP